ncbi:MAG: response regulator, partial [Pirellulaceae bacterium]|nr:response regulator [Pirellulaceae bacterium]
AFGMKASSLDWIREDETKELPWVESLETGEMVSGRILRLDLPDRRLTFSVNSTPIAGCGVMVIMEDITLLEENKEALANAKEAAERANQSKSAFLANMSHEIRTPMNAILGFTEVLRRNIERDEQKRQHHLNTIHTSGTHLLNLINDILDLSKIEADRLEVESIPCAAHRVVADVATVMRVRADEKNISLDYQFDGPIPESITSDPARVRQILTNLVGNAIKFTEQGGVRIVTRLETQFGRPQIVFQVVDTGIGMTQEAADKIFDPFSQADASVTRRFGGTGLGLSISKRFAEALGGAVNVTSEEGIGSVFTVTIDAGSLDGVEMITPTLADLESDCNDDEHLAIHLPGMRVLLVDDGEENRDLMSVILEEAGTDFMTAENGLQAVQLATEQEWDVILMDMQMPVMDGYTATRTLREQGYDKPIVALTAHAMQHAEQECLDAGCSGFLTKPINFDRLITTLAAIAGVDTTTAQVKTESAPSSPAAHGSSPSRLPILSTLNTDNPKFRVIVEKFVRRLPEQIDLMRQAMQQGNDQELADLGHWLKGSGPNVGFAAFADPAKELEQCARQSDFDRAADLLDEIDRLCHQVVAGMAESEQPMCKQEVAVAGESKHNNPIVAVADDSAVTDKNRVARSQDTAGKPIVSTLPVGKPRFRDAVTKYVDCLDAKLDELERAVEREDVDELSEIGQWIRDASGTCGFAVIAGEASAMLESIDAEDHNCVVTIAGNLTEMRRRIEIQAEAPSV